MSHLQHAKQSAYATGNSYFVQSYAKINLTLDVVGRRSDGYHELATIMQTIDLYDTLCLRQTDEDQVHVVCSRSELNSDDNLAVRAAQAVRLQLGITQGVVIELHKRIPVAAGLGGGSSNAAAVLLALQEWWRLQLSPADMLSIAASLGSDVPFFLTGGLALCEGRGERITPLVAPWPPSMRWLLLLKPAISIATARVFQALPPADYSDGGASRRLVEALQAGRGPQPEDLQNSLERGVLEHYPEVARAKADLLQAGASLARLSGSGPTLYAPFPSLSSATRALEQLQASGYEVYLARPVSPEGGESDI